MLLTCYVHSGLHLLSVKVSIISNVLVGLHVFRFIKHPYYSGTVLYEREKGQNEDCSVLMGEDVDG